MSQVPASRPLLSVMLPTYNAGPYLTLALRSVLTQDMGVDLMEIVVVDDASPADHLDDVLKEIPARDRVQILRHSHNIGLAGNWNRCIQQARGEFIHILHQDDVVLPGFYAHMVRGLMSAPGIGMAFCRYAYIDSEGQVDRIAHREQWSSGPLPHWLQRISLRQRIQCPAVLVRRSVYETLGGFDANLKFALDWEMWVRIAANFAVWYEPKLLAQYRRHAKAQTVRLRGDDQTDSDMLAAIHVIANYSPPNLRTKVRQRAFGHLLKTQIKSASKMLSANRLAAARKTLDNAHITLDQLASGITKWWHVAMVARLEARIAARSSKPAT